MRRTLLVTVLSLLLQGCDEGCKDDAACDDGVFCNGTERCRKGTCATTLQFPCDDGDACTIDLCIEAEKRCVYEPPDLDGDGFMRLGCGDGDDCNDLDPEVHPGAAERCNGRDDDCDGEAAEDRDDDGRFDPAVCPDGDDCNDDDRAVHPGAVETCDGVDTNCSGGIDDEADTDDDGAVDPTCGGDDCDDEDATRSPAEEESCNAEDDNCDGNPDETFDCIRGEVYECETTCGSTGTMTCSAACAAGPCDPPPESCNGLDDDCDTIIDNDLPCSPPGGPTDCVTTCGSTGSGACTAACQLPEPEDCAPPSSEACNGIDDDCDGEIDEGLACVPGEAVPCTTVCGSQGIGACTETCGMPAADECPPPEEICFNFEDDNCDGYIDEFCY